MSKDILTLNNKSHKKTGFVRLIILAGLSIIMFLPPFFQGLFFENEFLPAIILIAAVFMLCMVDQLSNQNPRLFSHPLDYAMLALVLAYGLSLISAIDQHKAIVELLKVCGYFMVYWMACRVVRNEQDFSKFLFAAYLAALGMAIIGLGAALGWVHLAGAYEDGHIRSTLQYHNALGIYLAALNIVGLALGVKTKRFSTRLFLAGGNYLLILAILGTLSRGTWILYPVALIGFILLIPRSVRRQAIYQLVPFIICGLLAGRFFFNSINHTNQPAAAVFLVIGLLLTLILNMLHLLPTTFSLNMKDKGIRLKQLFAAGSIVLILIGVTYFSSHPLTPVLRYIIPDTAIARAEKTSVQDNSFQERLTTYHDALKIIKDYPLTGVGGGGWEALYHSYADHLYWVNEMHSIYLAIALDAGIIGLTVFSMIGIIFFLILLRTRLQNKDTDRTLFWAAGIAVILIALHSVFDFELSMAAVGFLFYGFIGACRGRITDMEEPSERPKDNKRNKKGVHFNQPPRSVIIMALTAVILTLVIAGTAACFYTAGWKGEQGAQALEEKRLDEAKSLYLQASRLDSYKGDYQVNLAQITAIKANQNKNQQEAAEAVVHARKASELAPYDASVHSALFGIYGLLGMVDAQIQELRTAIRANPFRPDSYDQLAQTAMGAAWPCLDRKELVKANNYFTIVLEVRNEAPPIVISEIPYLNLAAGQSALLLGDFGKARAYLGQAEGAEENYSKPARLWMSAVDYEEQHVKINRTAVDLQGLLLYLKQGQDLQGKK